MRRLVFIVCAIFAAAAVVFLSSLSAKAQTGGQYEASGGEESSGDSPSSEGFVSQGSVADADSPGVVAAREDLAEEERLPDYSQVVDNTTKGAFRAPGWKVERGSLSHEGGFVSAEGAKAPARFKLKIPTTNDYSVYAWWPKIVGGGTARYGVQTASGTKWSKVEQRADSSGMWIKVGNFAMEQGRRSVQVAAKSVDGGRVFADAVAVVRGEAAPPEDDQTMTASGARTIDSKAINSFTGWDVVRKARRHLGDRYRYGTCTWSVKSCTCLTKKAVAPFGHRMGMTEGGQWRYDGSWRVWRKANLRPGDEVFFKEGGSKYITHVGIYSGNGNIVHASSYFGKVVEGKMKYITGYHGAKRFKSR
jgi:cell wall-associated NlpC family hydrolase